jgi:hypothetical protein
VRRRREQPQAYRRQPPSHDSGEKSGLAKGRSDLVVATIITIHHCKPWLHSHPLSLSLSLMRVVLTARSHLLERIVTDTSHRSAVPPHWSWVLTLRPERNAVAALLHGGHAAFGRLVDGAHARIDLRRQRALVRLTPRRRARVLCARPPHAPHVLVRLLPHHPPPLSAVSVCVRGA